MLASGNLDTWAFDLYQNTRASDRGSYGFAHVLSVPESRRAFGEITQWEGYAPTPLRSLSGLRAEAELGAVFYKDEAARFGLGSFKALGGAYAVSRLLQRLLSERVNRRIDMWELTDPSHREWIRGVTVSCASDGNHGRSVAAAAQRFGCNSRIFLHEGVSIPRARAISDFGAIVVRTPGNYDDSVRHALRASAMHGWHVVADTAEDPADPMPVHVMHGYATLIIEALEQLREVGSPPPTHVFLQSGVGGLAAGVISYLWQHLGPHAAPIFIVVEPSKADCLYQSAISGKPTSAKGDLNTLMAGLSCGEVSRIAWPILRAGAEFFMTIQDAAAIECMRLLRRGVLGAAPMVAGESAVAGLAGLLASCQDPSHQTLARLRIDRSSIVLLVGTEGATDPDIYEALTKA